MVFRVLKIIRVELPEVFVPDLVNSTMNEENLLDSNMSNSDINQDPVLT